MIRGKSDQSQKPHPNLAAETRALPLQGGDLYPLGGLLIIAGYVLMSAI